MKRQLTRISKRIQNVNADYERRVKRLEKERDAKIRRLTNGMEECVRVDLGKKFNKKTNSVHTCRCGCDDFVPRKDFYRITVEDYSVRKTYHDSGYGDDDQFAVIHAIDEYSVCPICGKMSFLKSTEIERGIECSRYSEREGFSDIIPLGWKPVVTVVKRAGWMQKK